QLFDSFMSPLREISNKGFAATPDDLMNLWWELQTEDVDWAFRAALFEFSYFSDVTIDKALAPPEPAALVAKRLKPTILGQPDIPEGVTLVESKYYSLIPAYLRTGIGPKEPTFLMTVVLRKNVDWEKQGDEYMARLNLRVSFQDKKTHKLTEFFTGFKQTLTKEEFERRDEHGDLIGSLVTYPKSLHNYADGIKPDPATLGSIMKQLEPGKYVVNVYLQHTLTKKYNAWREEIKISE
ncbi:MAG: hypothetical protein AAB799_00885, partial [Patescibacteria group bacterium]